ncbi:hypothetical protein Aconfl_33610 [Algoriphagus confluentis]|uniref:Uncharacterized protein n=1 Tax=Algoriphagus confluentis TaxID=1697556 RepID=A0ABQ6PRY2_9BACT|nr:hypothetical protein Aconfl_33610 [Algoriphagus confluentis]
MNFSNNQSNSAYLLESIKPILELKNSEKHSKICKVHIGFKTEFCPVQNSVYS